MKLIIIIIINIEKKNVQNLKWATAHMSRRLGVGRWGAQAWALGVGREGVWQALGVRGRVGGRCRQLGARARAAGARGMRGRARRVRGRGAAGRAELAGHRRCARGHARLGRGLGAGWVCWLGQLG